jgi:hypothetical protein
MFEALGHRFPTFRIPFWIVYAIAYLCELFYGWFGVEPWVTRTEVDLVGVANTFSIESAKRELQYRPRDSHNLEQTILHMNQNQQCKLGGSSTRKQIEHL